MRAGLGRLAALAGGGTPFAFALAGCGLGVARSGIAMIHLDNLTVSFDQHAALHHVSGLFAKGSLTAVVGPNGAGKSTLLKSILGLLQVEGHIKLACPRSQIAYLPQQSEIDRGFPLSVLDCVLLGFWQGKGLFGALGKSCQAQAMAALQTVGLEGFAARPVGSLSAGQFQRVLFARLLVQDSDVILLDEPFAAIDSRTTAALLEVVKAWHQEGRTLIAVVHDAAQVQEVFPSCLLLARRVVAWGDTAAVMTPPHLQAARFMAEAWDEQSPLCSVPGPHLTDKHAAPHAHLHV